MMAISLLNTNYPPSGNWLPFLPNTNMHTECVGKDKVTDNMCVHAVLCMYTAVCIVRLLLTLKRCFYYI